MKDKPAKRTTFEEVANKIPKKTKSGLIIPDDAPNLKDHSWDTVFQERIDYNNRITELDPDYAAFKPYRNMIVRMFLIAPKVNESGIIESTGDRQVFAQGSQGTWIDPQKTSYPFSRKAIVVAVPEDNKTFSPGDIILLDRHMVVTERPSKDMPELVKFAFTLPEWPDFHQPTDVKDKHYGYLCIDPFRGVQGWIKK